MSFWRDMLTARDNATYDFLRFSTLAGGLTLIFNATWSTVAGHPFDANAFGVGFAAIVASGGIGVRVARPLEPMPGERAQPEDGGSNVGDSIL